MTGDSSNSIVNQSHDKFKSYVNEVLHDDQLDNNKKLKLILKLRTRYKTKLSSNLRHKEDELNSFED